MLPKDFISSQTILQEVKKKKTKKKQQKQNKTNIQLYICKISLDYF